MGLKPPFRRTGLPASVGPSSYDAEARRAEAPDSMPHDLACPFCEGTDTEIMSAFGAHASVATYWCRVCRSPFETLKWRGRV